MVAKRCKSGKGGFGTPRPWQADAEGCLEMGKRNRSVRRKHRLANRVELLLERDSRGMILKRDWHWTIEDSRLDPGGKPLGGHEVGETVARPERDAG